jgi:hypothetical protein
MSNVILVTKKKNGSVIGAAMLEEDAFEIGKRLVFTFDDYESARIEDETGKPKYVIDKDIPDWTVCEPVTQG